MKGVCFGLSDYRWSDFCYDRWLRANRLTPELLEEMRREVEGVSYRPKVSVVMPVYNIEGPILERAILSVMEQVYENWELCIADDASPSPHIRETLEKFMAKDSRIRVKFWKPM